jgi:cysteine sulfinate desulfinase/cysteine desulfurase-like protein
MVALERDFFDLAQKRGLALVRESPTEHAPGIFCISLPWAASMEELLMELNRRQICVSRFSACSARVDGPSTVLNAMGRPVERSSRSLRIGLGRWNKRDDLYALIQGLEAMVPKAARASTQ